EAELSLPGLTARPQPLVSRTTKFDLTLELAERRDPAGEPLGIAGELEYSHDRFEAETAAAIGERLVRLLGAAVESPDAPLHQLDLLSPQERHALLEGFNAPARPVPRGTLPELFEAQAACRPEAVALVDEDQELTYGEL